MKKNLNEKLALVLTAVLLTGCATADTAADTAAEKASMILSAPQSAAPYAKTGFYTTLDKDGRLWVFPEGSDDLKAYQEKGKPAKQVRRVGAGPQGQTLISTEMAHIDAYLASKAGFYTTLDKDGRLWVFPEGSDDLKAYQEKGKPAKQVRRVGAGPQGQTLISTEMAHIDAYLISKPGFYTTVDKDGRLWVFPEGSDDLKAYQEKGKPAKQVRRVGAGPQGQTLISTEMAHIDAYLAN